MRKWLGIGILSVAVCGGGAYWYFTTPSPTIERRDPIESNEPPVAHNTRHDGDAEASDVIEPLIVDRGSVSDDEILRAGLALRQQGASSETRVLLTPETPQPPRPDADPRRMPYADEGDLAVPVDALAWILQSMLPRLKMFEQPPNTGTTEESEPPANPPVERPANVVPDYHQQYPHCPYHGPCPYRY